MRYSSLMSFLNGFTPPERLASEIDDEVAACLAAMAKGGSGRVVITDGPPAVITREQVKSLVDALATGRIPLSAASYIADALIMSDDFDFGDDLASEAVFFLSDDSSALTADEINALRQRFSSTG